MIKNKFFLSLTLGLGLVTFAGCGGSDNATLNGEQTAEQAQAALQNLPYDLPQNGILGSWFEQGDGAYALYFVESNRVTLVGICENLTAKVVTEASVTNDSITIQQSQQSTVTGANNTTCSVSLQAGTVNYQMQGEDLAIVGEKQLTRFRKTGNAGNNAPAENNNNGGGVILPGGRR